MKRIKAKWHRRFIELAHHIALWSKDPRTKVGAVITRRKKIVSIGFNGAPAGTKDKHIKRSLEVKYRRTIHAETNAILSAGVDLTGTTIYCTHFPCAQCAAKIIQVGIKKVVFPAIPDEFGERWASEIAEAKAMFCEAGVKLKQV